MVLAYAVIDVPDHTPAVNELLSDINYSLVVYGPFDRRQMRCVDSHLSSADGCRPGVEKSHMIGHNRILTSTFSRIQIPRLERKNARTPKHTLDCT